MKQRTQLSAGSNQRLHSFGLSHDPFTIRLAQQSGEISTEDAVERLEHTNREGLVAAGKMATELAFAAPNFDTTTEWINRASACFDRATRIPNTGQLGSTVAEAKLSMAQLPVVSYLALFNQLPPTKLVEKAYEATLDVAQEVSVSFEQQARRRTHDATLLIGMAAESAVLLLGQRYALTSSIDEASWLPLHSQYSEDHANRAHRAHNRAWDVTFFTDIGQGPEKSYLAQVKASDKVHEDRRHRGCIDTITMINFSPDLSFKSERRIAAIATLDELSREASGDGIFTHNLEARTDKLLDLLDS